MPGVRATVNLTIDAILTAAGDLGTPKVRNEVEKALEFLEGTGAINQADLMFSDTRTLAASATENLDLAGVLASAFGATITAAELVLLYIEAASGNTNDVQLTRPATNGVPIFMAAGDGRALGPGEFELIISTRGIPVVAATGDIITLTNSAGGTSVTYNVLAIARSVAA